MKNLGVSWCPLVSSMSHYGHQSPVMASALAHSSCFFQMLEHSNISSVCVEYPSASDVWSRGFNPSSVELQVMTRGAERDSTLPPPVLGMQ